MARVISFDLDGTLFDDRQYVRAGLLSAAEFLADHPEVQSASGELAATFLETYFQRGIRDSTFDVVLEERGLPASLVPRLVDAYHDTVEELVPYPGVIDMLETLASDHDLAVVTGGRNGHDKLERLRIDDYFETVIVTDGRGFSKRDPDPFETILDDFGVSPADAVFVGDRPELDFPQPNRLGITTVRIRTGQYADVEACASSKASASVGTIAELRELLSNLD